MDNRIIMEDYALAEPIPMNPAQSEYIELIAELMTIRKLLERLEFFGYEGGRIHITHCMNMPVAKAIKKDLLEKFPQAEIFIDRCRGLCSFYAERGGVLIGFEKA